MDNTRRRYRGRGAASRGRGHTLSYDVSAYFFMNLVDQKIIDYFDVCCETTMETGFL